MYKEPLRAIFFDFDGVLVDSTRTKTEAFRVLFREYPEEIIEQVVDYHRHNGGISRVHKIAHAHEHIIGTPLSEVELARWAMEYSQLVVDKVIGSPWIEGAMNFLKSMHNRLRFFVISGTPEEELKLIIQCREASHYFEEILGSPTTKPHHFQRLLEQHGFSKHEVIFIGDALSDLRAAEETGLPFLGIRGEIDFPEGTEVIADCSLLYETLMKSFYL